jgi:hypothetical protein
MQRLTPKIPLLLTGALVALALAGQGGARSSEQVRCSSTTTPRDSFGRLINLTGKWTADDRQPYYLRQIGNCLWWTGSRMGANVFFGTVSGSTVVGVWADVRKRSRSASGKLALRITSEMTVLLRTRSTGAFPARSWRRTR